jgi:hypothetical protein
MNPWLDGLVRASDHVSTFKAASAGVISGGAAITIAALDPSSMELWLRLVTLGLGLVTTVASGGLIALKYWDRWQGRD